VGLRRKVGVAGESVLYYFSFRFESRRRRLAMWPAAPDILQSYWLFDAICPLYIAESIATSSGM